MNEARHIYEKEKRVSFADTAMAALDGADALVIVTEWKDFRSPDFDAVKQRAQVAGDLRRAQPLRARGGARRTASSTSRSGGSRRNDAAARLLAARACSWWAT